MAKSTVPLLMTVVQIGLLTSTWAGDLGQAEKDRAMKKVIAKAFKIEESDPEFSKLKPEAKMVRVIARVLRTTHQEDAARIAQGTPVSGSETNAQGKVSPTAPDETLSKSAPAATELY
jgi:hypothetical protein